MKFETEHYHQIRARYMSGEITHAQFLKLVGRKRNRRKHAKAN